ncbi:hypothetical protein CAter282_2069 [Collimonas arenae]|uniref:Uncharacterized protein n=1 Tax=Collimonas arenae TaxID=279058 RepID=A0A127PQ84_9BURK|nr:hypothetical protein CAter10_2248 [Collimonas arenae]AMP09828.1 hypothetical protein CAter282_2069 [Collimonas arenae]
MRYSSLAGRASFLRRGGVFWLLHPSAAIQVLSGHRFCVDNYLRFA